VITFSLAFVGLVGFGLFGVFDLRDVSTYASFVGTCLLFSLPAIYLHISYLLDNRRTVLRVDKNGKRFTLTTQYRDFNYGYEDIEKTELNRGIYYKNQLDNRGRWPAPWTNYGYLKLKLKDGKEFIFTSMMLDLTKLPFQETTTKFRLIPYINKSKLNFKDVGVSK
jgi:hypothetical protein